MPCFTDARIIFLAEIRFSIVIVHRNGEDMLLRALSALMPAVSDVDEVIVVDNGSTDASMQAVRSNFPTVSLIENGCNNGFARACNQGVAASRGRYVLFLNNDAFLPADALDRFARDFETYPSAALIGGQLVGEDGRIQRSAGVAPTFLSELGLLRKRQPAAIEADQPVEVETLVGACMAFRRAAAENAGLLDEDFFFYFEETEWCVRLRRQGWQVMVDPGIRVTHLKGASTRAVRRDAQVEMFRSRLLYYWKTMSPPLASLLTVWRVVRLLVNTVSYFLMGLLSLGLIGKVRARLMAYLTQLGWLLAGCPAHWGLPDKCPRRS